MHQFNILREHQELRVEAECVVLVHAPKQPVIDGMPLLELTSMQDQLADEFYDLLAPSVFIPHTRELSALAELAEHECNGTVGGFVDAAVKLIHSRFKYEKGATHVNSSISDSLQSRSGVCQDFAHILIGLARVRGLPARYVSGYLVPKKTAAVDAQRRRSDRRPGVACLGRSVRTDGWLGGPGSHTRPRDRTAAHSSRLWERLRGCASGPRSLQRTCRATVIGRCEGTSGVGQRRS